MKHIAESGAKRMTCFLRYTPPPQEVDVGFATIKGSINSGSCGRITPNFGNCFSNGITIALLHSMLTDTQYMISTNDSLLKMRVVI